jgi:CTP synthase (UTP-ammonia lyase)
MTAPHVAIIGDHQPDMPTHAALDAAAARLPHGITTAWMATDALTSAAECLAGADGLWVAPGSPYRSFDGALGAIRYAREAGIPLLGT